MIDRARHARRNKNKPEQDTHDTAFEQPTTKNRQSRRQSNMRDDHSESGGFKGDPARASTLPPRASRYDKGTRTPEDNMFDTPAFSSDPDSRSYSDHPESSKYPTGKEAHKPEKSFVWLGVLASILWVIGVAAYAIGRHSLTSEAEASLGDTFLQVSAAERFITLAVMLAPLGLVWLIVGLGRRTEMLAAQTRRLDAFAPLADVAAVDWSTAMADAERARHLLEAIKEELHQSEHQARRACRQLEEERQSLIQLVHDFEADAERVTNAFSGIRDQSKHMAVKAIAREIADILGQDTSALRPHQGIEERSSYSQSDYREHRDLNELSLSRPSYGSDDYSSPSRPSTDRYGSDDYSSPSRPSADRYGSDDYSNPSADRYGSDNYSNPSHTDSDRYGSDDYNPSHYDNPSEAPNTQDQSPLQADSSELNWTKLVRAANFPDSQADHETLNALYEVLADPEAAALLQAAEDSLALLADIGLYMEDFKPEHAPIESWRQFILHGDKRSAQDLNGIDDTQALNDIRRVLQDSPDFADAVECFMDRYEGIVDRLFCEISAVDLVVELADTRTGRAYMLLGQATGRFG